MNLRLWLQLFITQFLVLLLIVVAVLTYLVYGAKLLSWDIYFAYQLLGLPLYLIVLAMIITLAIIVASFFSFRLIDPIEQIRAKINWLLLGKYQHAIFKQKVNRRAWYDSAIQTEQDIFALRDKLIQLSADLQEFTAAPVFIGEDTKEEIIVSERNRIARELHDSVSQQLFAATMMISAIRELAEKDNSAIVNAIRQVEQTINNAQTEMRALLLHLRPIDLADQSLSQGIANLINELSTKIPIKIDYQLSETNLDSGIEDHLFRIVQEALSNTLRHAKAQHLEIFLQQDANLLQLKIVDDGIGFDIPAAKAKGNYGLRNMEERVTSLGGNFNLVSLADHGTSIDIKIPVVQKGSKQ